MTQLEYAKTGKLTPEMRLVAKAESSTPETIRKSIAAGRVVIPKNRLRSLKSPCGIGEGLATKINANIGTSKDHSDISQEIKKMDMAIKLGSDTVMDLSTGSKIAQTRKMIISKSAVPVGTVPIYEMVIEGIARYGSIKDIPVDFMFEILRRQAREKVDFFTIHSGVTRKAVEALKKDGRLMGIVSRGGAFLADWMIENGRENPFYENFDEVLKIAKEYDVTLSLGDGLRPGSIADATDRPQILELLTLGELQKRSVEAGVQVMIEGPGHVPMNQISANVAMEKAICNGAPFYVLGPLVTDIAPGYDHITAAIGGAIAGSAGADFLCYVTPAEHLRLPSIDDVREGVIASKIAAHAADIAKGVGGAFERDIAISGARAKRDWQKQFNLALDQKRPREYRNVSRPGEKDVCTMCSDYCSIKLSESCLKKL